jgi:hypothetical protein
MVDTPAGRSFNLTALPSHFTSVPQVLLTGATSALLAVALKSTVPGSWVFTAVQTSLVEFAGSTGRIHVTKPLVTIPSSVVSVAKAVAGIVNPTLTFVAVRLPVLWTLRQSWML